MPVDGQPTLRERLASLETLARASLEGQREVSANVAEFRGEMRRALHGDGGVPGLVLRVDRMEEGEKRRSKVFWMMFTATVGALAAAVSSLFGHDK